MVLKYCPPVGATTSLRWRLRHLRDALNVHWRVESKKCAARAFGTPFALLRSMRAVISFASSAGTRIRAARRRSSSVARVFASVTIVAITAVAPSGSALTVKPTTVRAPYGFDPGPTGREGALALRFRQPDIAGIMEQTETAPLLHPSRENEPTRREVNGSGNGLSNSGANLDVRETPKATTREPSLPTADEPRPIPSAPAPLKAEPTPDPAVDVLHFAPLERRVWDSNCR